MRGGELLLTTGYTIRDDPSAALERLVPALAERDLAGLVIKLGLYVDAIPDDVAALADQLGFPLVACPRRRCSTTSSPRSSARSSTARRSSSSARARSTPG